MVGSGGVERTVRSGGVERTVQFDRGGSDGPIWMMDLIRWIWIEGLGFEERRTGTE
jgi:hypothetical protein